MSAKKRDESKMGEGFSGSVNKIKRQCIRVFCIFRRMVGMMNVSNGGLGRGSLKVDIQIRFGKNCRHDLNVFIMVG